MEERQRLNVKKWLEALRSGKYKRGPLKLHSGERYCCLGVACEILAEEHNVVVRMDEDFGVASYNGKEQTLPYCIQEAIRLRTENGSFITLSGVATSLTELNDSGNYSFEQIADIIESEPCGLFYKEKAFEYE